MLTEMTWSRKPEEGTKMLCCNVKSFRKRYAGIHGQPNRSKFLKRDAGIHGPLNRSEFLKRDAGVQAPLNRSEILMKLNYLIPLQSPDKCCVIVKY